MTQAEQEYLKHIYLFTHGKSIKISTKHLAGLLNLTQASVTDMIKKLANKELIKYNKYYGCSLSDKGLKEALQITRRNRLWELFMVNKLGMDWKEVDVIATQLQSITSRELIDRLFLFLGQPTYDPHGEGIPDHKGKMPKTDSLNINELKLRQPAKVFGYRDTVKPFLEYIEKLQLRIGTTVEVVSQIEYGLSVEILVNKTVRHVISKETAQKIYVTTNGREN